MDLNNCAARLQHFFHIFIHSAHAQEDILISLAASLQGIVVSRTSTVGTCWPSERMSTETAWPKYYSGQKF